jgi:predicted helicase
LIKKILDNNGFLTQLITCKQFNFTLNKYEYFGDGGVDIIATYKNSMCIYIQCKCLSKQVGPCVIREINGVRNQINNGNQKNVCVVSKKGFTSTAIKEAKAYNVIIADENNICEILIDYYNDVFLKQKKNNITEIKIEYVEDIKINDIHMLNVKNCVIKY